MDTTTQQLVTLALELRAEDLPEGARRAAKARILSSLAVSLPAIAMEPIRIARSLAQPVAAGPAASIFATRIKTTPDMAAFVNSAMVRALDMNDAYVMAGVSHPSDVLPALIAVAEAEGQSGLGLLLAAVLAYEVQCRFVDVVPYSHRGWDQTPIVALGAALGCGTLLGLTAAQLQNAISLAIAPNLALNQTRTGTLSMWKGMAGPQGARAGVGAAYMARAGMTGPDEVFEGKFGLWQQMMGGERYQLPIPSRFAGHTFAVQQTALKSFPIRFGCHVPVFAAQQLRAAVDVRAITRLKIEAIRQAFGRWMDVPEVWDPQTRETADHSLPCCVAMALLAGTITPRMMEEERFRSADVLDLMRKCTIELPDDFAALFPQTRCCRLTATLSDGREVVAEYRSSMADDAADSGWSQARGQFLSLSADLLDAKAQHDLVKRIDELEVQARVDPLLELLAAING